MIILFAVDKLTKRSQTVHRIKVLDVPMPQQPTVFTCTLNNGIHRVTTPELHFSRDAPIEQEFEL